MMLRSGRGRRDLQRDLIRRTAELLADDVAIGELVARIAAFVAPVVVVDAVAVIERDVQPVRRHHSGATLDDVLDALPIDASAAVLLDARTVAIPMFHGGAPVAIFVARSAASIGAEDVVLFESCARILAARLHDDRLTRLAALDGLTGIANRRSFDARLAAECTRSSHTGRPVALLLVDVDEFKAYNDAYGHPAGDVCLQRIARTIADAMTPADEGVARYGGEEFAVIVPATDAASAETIAERVRSAVVDLKLEHRGSSLGYVSVSIGVASAAGNVLPEHLVATADAFLYRAKRDGRNRVVGAAAAGVTPGGTAIAPNGPLPTWHDRFIGRHEERRTLAHRLGTERLVTLVGSGGVGKTRLAVEVARTSGDRFPGGVAFVDLVSAEAETVGRAIADAFDVHAAGDDDALESIALRIAERDVLLVLDNAEHVAAACARAARALLDRVARLTVLVTSREPLAISGEWIVAVAPMRIARDGDPIDARTARAYDGLALLAERASTLVDGFTIDDASAPLLARIARRVEGLPLSLELAAARLDVLTLAELAGELDERFTVLRATRGDVPARQANMDALIEWSYGRLDSGARSLFCRLSIFAGGWTAATARAVCSAAPLDPIAVLDHLATLVRTSLVVVEEHGANRRFTFLEPTRAFAAARASQGPPNDLARAHADAYRVLVEEAGQRRASVPLRTWMAGLRPELPNVRAALGWALGRGNDLVVGTKLTLALVPVWDTDPALASEGVAWLERALATDGVARRDVGALRCAGAALRLHLGDFARAAGDAAIAQAVFEELGDEAAAARAQWFRARGAQLSGDVAESERWSVAALAAARRIGDRTLLADALRARGSVHMFAGDVRSARVAVDEAVRLYRAGGDERGLAYAFNLLSDLAFADGDAATAVAAGRESMALFEALGDRFHVGWMQTNLGLYELARGDRGAAAAALAHALEIHRDHGNRHALAATIENVGRLAAAAGDAIRAIRLVHAADALYADSGPRQPYEARLHADLLRDLRERVGDAAFARERDLGAAMTLERANTEARAVATRVLRP